MSTVEQGRFATWSFMGNMARSHESRRKKVPLCGGSLQTRRHLPRAHQAPRWPGCPIPPLCVIIRLHSQLWTATSAAPHQAVRAYHWAWGTRGHWQAKSVAAASLFTHAKTSRSRPRLTKPTQEISKWAHCQDIVRSISSILQTSRYRDHRCWQQISWSR
jgi:hypothetical protein